MVANQDRAKRRRDDLAQIVSPATGDDDTRVTTTDRREEPRGGRAHGRVRRPYRKRCERPIIVERLGKLVQAKLPQDRLKTPHAGLSCMDNP